MATGVNYKILSTALRIKKRTWILFWL